MGIECIRRTTVLFVFIVTTFVTLFGLVAALQAAYIHGLGLGDIRHDHLAASLAVRIVANGLAVVLAAVLASISGLERRAGWPTAGMIVGFSVFVAVVRMGVQLAFSIHPRTEPSVYVFDALMAAVVVALGFVLGRVAVAMQQRISLHEQWYAEEKARSAAALAALQAEELRVRREVADELHGSIQQSLVLVHTDLTRLLAETPEASKLEAELDERLSLAHDSARDRLRDVIEKIDRIRENDVRQVSHALYPSGIEVGLAQALRAIVARVPDTIAVTVQIADAVAYADGPAAGADAGLSPGRRLLLVRVFEEALSNALRHGHASEVHLTVTVERAGRQRAKFVLCVDDDGQGLPKGPVDLSGLAQLRQRLVSADGELTVTSSPLGGVRVTAQLNSAPMEQASVRPVRTAESAFGVSAE